MARLGMQWGDNASESSEQIKFISSVDWASTSLGPREEWPSQLTQTVDFLLTDPNPAAVMWGEELTMIYNEPFAAFAGQKHPKLMGRSPITEYAEVWESMFASIIHKGRMTGQATQHHNVQLFLLRNSFLEECWVTYTFVPMIGKSKSVVGFYHTVSETTTHLLQARRNHTQLAIVDAVTSSRSMDEYWSQLFKVLDDRNEDIQWALAYSFTSRDGVDSYSESDLSSTGFGSSGRSRHCSLVGATSGANGKVPLTFDGLDQNDALQGLIKKMMRSGEVIQLDSSDSNLPSWLFSLETNSKTGEPYKTVLLMPIRTTVTTDGEGYNVLGFLIVGLAPWLVYDEQFEQFLHLVGRQLGTSAASILLLEQEVKRQKQLAHELTTSTKQARDLEVKFHRFTELSNIGMWIASNESKLVWANRTWYEQAGLPYDSLVSVEDWIQLIEDKSVETFSQQWRILMEKHENITTEVQFKAVWKSVDPVSKNVILGQRWILMSALAELNEDGSLKNAWGCNVDVSYQKWLQSHKEIRLQETLEAKRQTERFIDMVSHEIRNPLSAILMSSEAISSTIDESVKTKSSPSGISLSDPDVCSLSEAASIIITCAQHQKRIVDDILTLSKLDASLLSVSAEKIDPVATIKHAISLHQQEFKSARVDGRIQIHDSYRQLGVDRVFLDPSRLLQVLINLITNAIKFTQFSDKRNVVLHLSASSGPPSASDDELSWVETRLPIDAKTVSKTAPDCEMGEEIYLSFAVEDTGCGISSTAMEKLFQRFQQASVKTHSKYGGSGLGLFICRELIELQGGQISVSSKLGEGSTFRFYLRAHRAISIEEAADANAEQLKQVALDAQAVGGEAHEAVKTVLSPNYSHSLNRHNSAHSNPVVGSAISSDTLHVLIVEDNAINQKVMSSQLKKQGCIVHVADNGLEAIHFLRTTTFAKDVGPQGVPLSLILMDLEMPVMDGLTAIKRIREMQRTGDLVRPVPVIAVTANARLEQVMLAKECGMDDVVTKPFSVSRLMTQMRTLISKVST